MTEFLSPIGPPAQIVITEAYDRDTRLAEMNLSFEGLRNAVTQGHAQRGLQQQYDPKMIGGVNAWARAVRILSEEFCDAAWGWSRDDLGGQPRIFNIPLQLAVIVQAGNRLTGFADAHPRTKYPKGQRTQAAVNMNGAGRLFGALEGESEPKEGPIQTWLLLVHGSRSELRAELSLPSAMDKSNHVSDFSVRLILPMATEEFPLQRKGLPVDFPSPTVDVKVERRVG